ncbi:MAG: DUF370 domain-containing protein [Clostridiaceae bacterium]|nr:DUF370 domain-containing protein [Clostridiaceae bacterium]
MYLHIGEDEVVLLKDVVAIMDIEKTTTSSTTREFLKRCEEKKEVKTVGTDIPKTFILTVKDGKQAVYLSPISSYTLYKRACRQTY